MVCLKTNPTITFFNFIVSLNRAQGTWFKISVAILYPRGFDFIVVRSCTQNTWCLAISWSYSEFTSWEPRYLYKIRDPDFKGELARGCFGDIRVRRRSMCWSHTGVISNVDLGRVLGPTKAPGSLCKISPLQKTIRIHQDHLEFCPHNMRKTRCVLCGGRDICLHRRRRDSCRLCKGVQKRQGEMELRWWILVVPLVVFHQLSLENMKRAV